jgi:hypothetical protein
MHGFYSVLEVRLNIVKVKTGEIQFKIINQTAALCHLCLYNDINFSPQFCQVGGLAIIDTRFSQFWLQIREESRIFFGTLIYFGDTLENLYSINTAISKTDPFKYGNFVPNIPPKNPLYDLQPLFLGSLVVKIHHK